MPSIQSGPPASVLGRPSCRHLQADTLATVNCDRCQGAVKLRVYGCALHGRCTLAKQAEGGMPSCPTCPDYAPPDGLDRALPEIWPGLPDPLVQEYDRQGASDWAHQLGAGEVYRAALRKLIDCTLPDLPALNGEGIVTVGGGRYWPMMRVQLEMIRRHSDLPVQVWYQGDDEPVAPGQVAHLPAVTFHDVTKLRPAPRTLGGWQNKTTAILNSGFNRVLFLDADAYPVGDLVPLFDKLNESPFLWWQDLPTAAGNVKRYAAAVPDIARVAPVQGGQLLFCIPRVWRMILMAHWVNQHSDYWYVHQYGDQDSWRLALAVLGLDVGNLGPARWVHPAFVCDYFGAKIVHRCRGKLFGNQNDVRGDELPEEETVWSIRQRVLDNTAPAKMVFANVRASKAWGKAHPCGSGSTPNERAPYVALVNALAKVAGWQSCVDLGTGDGSVLSDLTMPGRLGIDCVDPPAGSPVALRPGIPFVRMDASADRDRLPAGHVALMKDVWHHWPNSLIVEWLVWARGAGKWQWLLVTSDCNGQKDGQDCELGGYRPLDPARQPLAGLGGQVVMRYAHKAVILFDLRLSPARKAALTRRQRLAEAAQVVLGAETNS